ncbi:MAG: aryl-sulfate sulfotransferase [Bryobacteraceae bacterium]
MMKAAAGQLDRTVCWRTSVGQTGRTCLRILIGALLVGCCAVRIQATPMIGAMTPSLPSPQLLGTPVIWTTLANDSDSGILTYRYNVRATGGEEFGVVRDFARSKVFTWAPADSEGSFDIQVIVRNLSTGKVAQSIVAFLISPRASTVPVVSASSHPLVAIYSAPACAVGSSMLVRFQGTGGGVPVATPLKPCMSGMTMNFYLAGMLPQSTYYIRHEVHTGAATALGPLRTFTPGAIPASVPFPSVKVLKPPTAQSSLTQQVLLNDYLSLGGTQEYPSTARDLSGNVIWYYPELGPYITRPIPGGTFLVIARDASSPNPMAKGQILREIDLAGNTVRETNCSRLSEQMVPRGFDSVGGFHHEAIRLTNGHTIVMSANERIFPAGTQGSTSPVDILGDQIIDLDENLQVAWAWNAFDHLDVNRAAVLGELCHQGDYGCPPLWLANTANDWLHGNSIAYVPADGSLILSFRHQDWVVKINYGNGNGSGDVIWRLGHDGDFTLNSTDPYPWFSHQHDAEYEMAGAPILSLFDNGNTRIQEAQPSGHSRGQALKIDEVNRVVTLALNADLGVYSGAFGSAQLLKNGSYHFMSGIVVPGPRDYSSEFMPDASINYNVQTQASAYRSFRMTNLYGE